PSEHPLGAHTVACIRMTRGPDHSELVEDLRLERQVLADLGTGDVRIDRLEIAANLRGSVGVEVVHVYVSRPTGLPDQDDRLLPPGWRLPSRGAQAEQVRQAQPAQGECADAEEGAARDEVEHDHPQWLNMNSLLLSSAHRTSSSPCCLFAC